MYYKLECGLQKLMVMMTLGFTAREVKSAYRPPVCERHSKKTRSSEIFPHGKKERKNNHQKKSSHLKKMTILDNSSH